MSALWLDVIRTADRIADGDIAGPRISVGPITVWAHPPHSPPPLPPANSDDGEVRFALSAGIFAALQEIAGRWRREGRAYDPAGVLQKWLSEYALTKHCTCDASEQATRGVAEQLGGLVQPGPVAATVQAKLTREERSALQERLGSSASLELFLLCAITQKALIELSQNDGERMSSITRKIALGS